MNDCTCKHVGYCDGSCTHPSPTLEELRITDLRATLFTITDLDHHWHGGESRATEIARAAILRDNDLDASQARQFLPTEDGEFNGNVTRAGMSEKIQSIVPEGCTGTVFVFAEGVLHVSKDGSGYIAVDEDQFRIEDDRCEGPDGPEGSVHWITRFPPGELESLRDFLNGNIIDAPDPAIATKDATIAGLAEDRRELLMAIENAARMAEQGILSADGGQCAGEIRALVPARFRAALEATR